MIPGPRRPPGMVTVFFLALLPPTTNRTTFVSPRLVGSRLTRLHIYSVSYVAAEHTVSDAWTVHGTRGRIPYFSRSFAEPVSRILPPMRASTTLAAILVTAGCASTLPDAIRHAPSPDISVAQARTETGTYVGQRVRWGGTIARVENREATTDIEIVARELDRSGRPHASDRSTGRFIAQVAGFLDPAVYAEGRQVTVAGIVASETRGRIGDHPYRYPVLKVDTLYLWPLPGEDRRAYYDPFYDPFFHPYGYPWRPWPYYYPY